MENPKNMRMIGLSRKMQLSAATAIVIWTLGTGCSEGFEAGGGDEGLGSFVPSLGISAPTMDESTSSAVRLAAETDATPARTTAEKLARREEILSRETVEECMEDFEVLTHTSSVSCFGPALAYTGHPDGTGSTDGCPAGASCLPSGDLGIWEATESSSGEACASAKLNDLVLELTSTVDTALEMAARVACVAQANGVSEPKSGKTKDLTEDFANLIEGATFNSVTIGAASGSSADVFATTVDLTLADGAGFYLVVQNAPLALTGGEKGRIFGYIDTAKDGGGFDRKGFSVIYDSDEDNTTYVLKSAIVPSTHQFAELFDVEGETYVYKYDVFLANPGSANYRDARYLVANVDKDNGMGSAKFVWQAGGGDKKARVFHVKTVNGGKKASDSGYAYYGYGPKFGSSVGTIGDLTGMCCSWAGPNATCSADEVSFDASGKAQSQYFERNSSGFFVPTSSTAKNNITYAPTKSCNYTTGSSFKYALSSAWTGTESDHETVTNDLATYSAGTGTAGNISLSDLVEPTF